ncbi:MAG: HEAT repeat domain-containing protein [Myxococcota bacterium]
MAEVQITEAEMKPRRFNPAMIALALIVAGLGGALLYIGFRKDAKKMDDAERLQEQSDIFVLPRAEQVPRWKEWAKNADAQPRIRQEALTQLALLGDEESIGISINALKDRDHGVRASAAQVLAFWGKEKAGEAKPALLQALKEAEAGDRRQILWSLVELGEPQVFNQALESYKIGEITTVQRLEGGRAFDPLKMIRLVSLDELAQKASDESSAVRQLVATILSETADPKHTDVLIKLVKDPEIVVASEAAVGLGKIGDDKARQPLLDALSKADKDTRSKFIEALRDGIGGEGLVLALDTAVKEPEQRRWFQLKQLFDMIHTVADPRMGDALVKWTKTADPHPHWRTEAGVALAEVGDVRAAALLGERMGIEPKDVYDKAKFWQADKGGHLTKTDRSRVVAARMLADLAVIHREDDDAITTIRENAEAPVIEWLTSRPQPHANGLRFLAAVGSKKGKTLMRDWAFPDDPLPEEGAQPPFPDSYATAQSALRYLGWMRDSRGKLLDQFDRKEDDKMDITQRGLEGAGLAMLGMALRAVAYGAAQGLAQWGPQDGDQVEEKLIEFIENELWHEEAREAACEALAWVSTEDTLAKVVEKVGTFASSSDPKEQFIGACYATTLSRKPIPTAVNMMVDLLQPSLEVGVRIVLGRAIGTTGLEGNPEAEQKLFAMLDDPEMRNAAALGLMMGGSADIASRTVATYGKKDREMALNDLKDMWYRAFGYWSDEDLDRGNLYRYVRNAKAIARVKIGDAPQQWAINRLQSQFDNLEFDNGPHSETRVVLRYRLREAAKGDDRVRAEGAIETLKFMKEQGTLIALRGEPDPTGAMAREAYHELMNPALSADDVSHLENEDGE